MKFFNKTLNLLLRFYLYIHYLVFVLFMFSLVTVAFPLFLLATYRLYKILLVVPIGPLSLQLVFTFLGVFTTMTLLGLGYSTSLIAKLYAIVIWIVVFVLKVFVCARFLRVETVLNIRLSKLSLIYTIVMMLIPIMLVILSYCISGSSYGDITFVLGYILAIVASVTVYSFAIDLTLLSFVKFYKAVKHGVYSDLIPAFLIVWTVSTWLIYPFIIHIPLVMVVAWSAITVLQIFTVWQILKNKTYKEWVKVFRK